MDFVAIDFETANERRDSACAIGLTEVCGGIAKEPVYHLIRPIELRFSHWNTKVHGIRAEDVCDALTLAELWYMVRPLLEGRLVIAHNASFDLSVLRSSLHSASIPVPRITCLCSLQLARRAWPDLASYSLGFLARFHGLTLKHHHAGSDSRACAELVLLAGETHGLDCLLRLAETLGINAREVHSSDQ
jgi:DNA polymerase-3 subunit epsilon